MDRARIEVYVAGGKQMQDAFVGLTRQDLLAVPIPGTWSLQQIAIHLLDSDLIASDRMKRVAAMEKPLLIGYDESAFNRLPGIDELDVQEACDLFARNRRMTATILRRLPDESFQRYGIHNEAGKLTLAEMVEGYIEHLALHLEFVAKKRALLGKAL